MIGGAQMWWHQNSIALIADHLFFALAWARHTPQDSDGLADMRLAGGRNQLSV